ncbi:hypothetical protein ACFHWS_28050 [Micromonospora sp. LOL_013]|uniref:hypothetical protein n=1 Tax=Micromonospora sp. LOL_013 TaxID=3345414 RepID=UPI003A88D0EB
MIDVHHSVSPDEEPAGRRNRHRSDRDGGYGDPRGTAGHALRVDATGEIRTDFWGNVKPVHGYSWQHAVPGYPAPGEPPYSLIGSVTAGATFVSGRGWYEAGSWFPIVGTRDTGTPSTSPCLLYEAAGLVGGRFQVTINDNNLSDNGGAATVTVRQWW